jgi:hypothetical protein
MRRRKAELSRRVNRDVRVEFCESGLTSYAGLELLIRYLRRIDLNHLIREHLAGLPGDFGVTAMVRVVLGMLIVGGRRLRHVGYLVGDPLMERFCGLAILPGRLTLSRWLRRFTGTWITRLSDLNGAVVARAVHLLTGLCTLTIDVDGTVLSTGMTVARAFRGFNPHHRKVPSYYPITAHLAETGHILRVKNRSGNINDGKASITFLRELFVQIATTLGRAFRLRFRMDADFFKESVLRLLIARGAGYAIKVPFWQWLDLQQRIRECRRWKRVTGEVGCFEVRLPLKPWNLEMRVVIYRKVVHHRSAKNFQLNLFDPDDGYFEYSAVATNLALSGRDLWHFMCGRGLHEKVIGELKGGLAFNAIPTRHYGANSAWQQLVALAHNLITSFQIETGAPRRRRSAKRTALHVLKSIHTLRFELLHRAGRIVRPDGVTILRLARNEPMKRLFLRIAGHLGEGPGRLTF